MYTLNRTISIKIIWFTFGFSDCQRVSCPFLLIEVPFGLFVFVVPLQDCFVFVSGVMLVSSDSDFLSSMLDFAFSSDFDSCLGFDFGFVFCLNPPWNGTSI